MDLNAQKEQFSIAYIHALVAAAGLKLDRCSVDDDSIDAMISRGGGRSPHLSLQFKCSSDIELRTDDFSFRLKLKNYNDLCRVTMVPRILAVLHVPVNATDWVSEYPDHLVLRYRAYWRNLLGDPEIPPSKPTDLQEKKVTLRIQLINLLGPASLVDMLDNIERADAV